MGKDPKPAKDTISILAKSDKSTISIILGLLLFCTSSKFCNYFTVKYYFSQMYDFNCQIIVRKIYVHYSRMYRVQRVVKAYSRS